MALRILPAGEALDLQHLVRESSLLAGIHHPNLCPIYEMGETAEGGLYLVVGYCEGETLARRLERGPLKPAAAVDVAVQVAAGLGEAHAHGLVHGNLRPANIFLAADGQVRIADFGFPGAAEETLLTAGEAAAVKAAYAAPEQLRGERSDARSDLWSLSVLLYEMVTGCRLVALHRPEPLRQRQADAPQELERIFARALALRPADRYSSAGELWRDLNALRERGSGYERPVSLPARSFGPYRLIALLGSGGMGVVYRAEDTRLGRTVALKLLPAALTHDPRAKARFQQEARAASALDHQNICTIYDVGETPDGQLYLAMPCYDGETLQQRLERGPLPAEEAVEIAGQIARGLAKAHRSGIVHRDIKPANLMITSEGLLKILDFGVAKLAGEAGLTHTGAALGTPSYMAPEQMRGEEVDSRADLWALGVVFYEMLTGRRPFPGDHEVVRDAILFAEPEPVVLCPGVPPALGVVVGRLLAKKLMDRYPAAEAVLDDLRSSGEITKPRSMPSMPPVPAGRPARRWLRWGGGIVAAVLAALAIGRLIQASVRPRQATPLRAAFTRLTDQDGPEVFPSLSPSGDFFVYAKAHDGNNSDIYLQRIRGGNPINLTADSPADDTQPAFSPDATLIAFRSERDGGGIFLMGATGESVHRVTSFGYNPAWSPDGKALLVSTAKAEDPWAHSIYSQIWRIEIATGAKRLLVADDGLQPSWSPNGRRIAYWSVLPGSGRRVLWTMPASGGSRALAMDDLHTNWNPVWSPDGLFLYFASDRSGSMNLWRVRIDQESGRILGDAEPVTTPAPWSGMLSIAPDGRRIAYVSKESQANLERIAFDPSHLRPVGQPVAITQGSRTVRSCDVSPDGRWLALFASTPQEDLFVLRTDGSALRQITNDPSKDRIPQWSPDGSRIVFYSNRSGIYQAWSIRPDGSGLEQLSRAPLPGLTYSIWSPDGRRLCSTIDSKGSALLDLTVPIERRRAELLAPAFGKIAVYATSWSPDGKRLAGHDPNEGIGIYDLFTRRYDRLTEGGAYPHWMSDNRTLLFLSGPALWTIDTVTRKAREILRPPASSAFVSLCLSRDDRSLFLVRAVDQADVWLLTLEP